MPFSLRRLSKSQWLAFSLVFLGAVVGFALSTRESSKSIPFLPALALQITQPAERLEVERATVRVKGFEPATITRPKKTPFFLIIENRTGLRELSFQIDNEAGNKVNTKDMKSPKGKMAWNGVIDLPPGKYRLTELTHREWSLAITIENK
jgi:hypothetical protein